MVRCSERQCQWIIYWNLSTKKLRYFAVPSNRIGYINVSSLYFIYAVTNGEINSNKSAFNMNDDCSRFQMFILNSSFYAMLLFIDLLPIFGKMIYFKRINFAFIKHSIQNASSSLVSSSQFQMKWIREFHAIHGALDTEIY